MSERLTASTDTSAGDETVRRPERSLTAQRVAQYITRNRCERFLHFALFPSAANGLAARYEVGFESLPPTLFAEGTSFEQAKVNELRAAGERVIDLTNKPTEEFFSLLRNQQRGRVIYYQPTLVGEMGDWRCEGRPDLVEAVRDEDGGFKFTVVDIKASARETVGYRLQVAFYAVLLGEVLRERGFDFAGIEGAIAARGTEMRAGAWPTFDLPLFIDEINALIVAPDSDVRRVTRASFEEIRAHLGHHCDGCPYNTVCFVHAAECEDLSLIPTLTATQKQALQTHGIKTARELAALIRYDGHRVEFAQEHAAEVAPLMEHWALGSVLSLIAQRAHAALNRRDKSFTYRRALYGSDWGTLPDSNLYPSLVKVFVDAGRDHVEDRLYSLAALITGPAGTRKVLEITEDVPDIEAERALLIRWLQQVLPAISATGDALAPLHIYVFDRRSSGALLTALERHFDALCAIPAFYDLLTSTPALTQSMISFLGDEVASRLNLGAICPNLYEVAQALGFDWKQQNLREQFHTSIFDNRRAFLRDERTKTYRAPKKTEYKSATLEWVESAARFGTEIPLEYAYAAWGRLSEAETMREETRAQAQRFMGTTLEHLRSLVSARLDALRHIEEQFSFKNRQVEKIPLDTERLNQTEVDPAAVPLNRVLEDFLRLEHYAALQERLQHLALPPDLRQQTGRTAALRCVGFDKEARRAEFVFADVEGNALPDASGLRMRDGDWATLNPLRDEETGALITGKRLVHGTLAIIERIDRDRLTLALKPMGKAGNSAFRFGHRLLEPEQDQLYTLDEMADDLNADKLLAACQNAGTNALYAWLENPEMGKQPRVIRPTRLRLAERFARIAHDAQQPHGLTDAQRHVVASFIKDRVLVLQGPPGTGKSHTLGFATLARAVALATPARPFRVAVSAKTHAAVKVALESIRKRADELLAKYGGIHGSINTEAGRDTLTNGALDEESAVLLSQLAGLRVYKLCNDEGELLPAGVEPVLAKGTSRMRPREQWEHLMRAPLLVIGGTPGGLYSLVKEATSRGRAINWATKHFDLIIVDEASQMGQAEALLASAFLHEDGQFIAIGDHRQMPPILAHAWDEEARRDLRRARPHLSIFDALREAGFATSALDESFRVPSEVAAFLQRHVYIHDDVNFHSRNKQRLPALPTSADVPKWVRAALNPKHPLIRIEHSEGASQQANEYESRLVEELVRCAAAHLALDVKEGIGIVVPHRAQKFLLRELLPDFAEAIDTVERFQGGERDLIIVSATASDPAFAAVETDFLLEPRRFTVAISRPRRKVIVIAARTVFDLLPGDLEAYERGSLWKKLRHESHENLLWQGRIMGQRVSIRAVAEKID
ncbi:MAG: hypothetical protein QOH25_1902 [Acidobacteriota bacterium]|jgi:hypothetical protein|nr:hypothetical protein [Acidobacteriota bacterium]